MDTFFSGKFNSLFAFLFGIGFTIQLDRLLERSGHPVATYLRRLGVLLVIGVAHGRKYAQQAAEQLVWWRQLATVSFVVAIVSALTFGLSVPFLVPFKPSWLGLMAGTAYSLQRPALVLFYAAAIVLLVHSERRGDTIRWFAPRGVCRSSTTCSRAWCAPPSTTLTGSDCLAVWDRLWGWRWRS